MSKLNDTVIDHTKKNPYKNMTQEEKEIAQSVLEINLSNDMGTFDNDFNNGLSKEEIINNYCEKTGDSPADGELKYKHYEKLKEYLDCTPPYEGTITRIFADPNGTLENLKEGGDFEINRLTSFGKLGNQFDVDGGNVMFIIQKNTKGKDISNLTVWKEEKEVLIPKGKYKVEKIDSDILRLKNVAPRKVKTIYLKEA